MAEPCIALCGVRHRRWVERDGQGWQPLEVLRGVTLSVARGEVVALVGRSGAGKSTLLRLVNRLEERTEGGVAVEGRDVRDWDVLALRRAVGSVAQVPAMFAGTVAENVGYGPRLHGEDWSACREAAERCVARVGLPAELLDRTASALSVGQQQRVAIARALANRPRTQLLDEPTAALDPASAGEILALLGTLAHTEGLAVLLVTHVPDHARLAADRVAVMSDGVIARAGHVAEIDLGEPQMRHPSQARPADA